MLQREPRARTSQSQARKPTRTPSTPAATPRRRSPRLPPQAGEDRGGAAPPGAPSSATARRRSLRLFLLRGGVGSEGFCRRMSPRLMGSAGTDSKGDLVNGHGADRNGKSVLREIDRKKKKNKKKGDRQEKDTSSVSASRADHDRECDGDVVLVGVADRPVSAEVRNVVSELSETGGSEGFCRRRSPRLVGSVGNGSKRDLVNRHWLARDARNVWRERERERKKKEKDTHRDSASRADHDGECDGDVLSAGAADNPESAEVRSVVLEISETNCGRDTKREEEEEEGRNLSGNRDKWGGNVVSEVANVATPCNVGKGTKKKREISVVAETNGGRDSKRRQSMGKQEEIATQGRGVESGAASPGWTIEQEAALHRAYILAKPTPHFWKKVSKMVPGKSAQECFDRMHSKIMTPIPPKPRSRVTKVDCSPLGFSDFFKKNARRPKSSKNKGLLVHKTVRHILRKHSILDQGQEADLFSVLETSPSLHAEFSQIEVLSNPEHITESPKLFQRSSGNLSSSHKKVLSRFKSQVQGNLASPEVLKPVKNMQLHEKYVDQLHCREARRRMYAKAACSVSSEDNKENPVLKGDVVKAATSALISEAREIIFQFGHAQATTSSNSEEANGSEDDCEEDA